MAVSNCCWHCGEQFKTDDACAELARVDDDGNFWDDEDSVIVHQEPCGTYMLRHGWAIA